MAYKMSQAEAHGQQHDEREPVAKSKTKAERTAKRAAPIDIASDASDVAMQTSWRRGRGGGTGRGGVGDAAAADEGDALR